MISPCCFGSRATFPHDAAVSKRRFMRPPAGFIEPGAPLIHVLHSSLSVGGSCHGFVFRGLSIGPISSRYSRGVSGQQSALRASRNPADLPSPHRFDLHRFDGDAVFGARDIRRDFRHAFGNREFRRMLFQLFSRHILGGAALA